MFIVYAYYNIYNMFYMFYIYIYRTDNALQKQHILEENSSCELNSICKSIEIAFRK